MAVRPTPRRSGGDALPIDVPRHERRTGSGPEVPRGDARRSGAVEQRSHRAEDATESAEERQAVPHAVPVSRRPMVVGRRARIALPVVAALALVVPLGGLIGAPEPATDYERELGRIDDALAGRPGATLAGPGGLTPTRIAYLRYRRATTTRRLEDFRAAQQAIDTAFDADGASDDLLLLNANLDFHGHRLDATRAGLERLSRRADRVQVRLLAADVALQEG